ncbi:multidrug ABC transporter ATP-binding protein [Streptomyces griseus]|uniref:ABC transporter ATP-binding protein n=1 Tax=Streptomyces globisporus TaxID=1908 RepID=UPI0005C8D56F|nr:ABC transporter ATP-binding protein [Streptomyces globisporus]AWL87547.1 ABC transporter ATP-binding protein [Streptomyces globisporus]PPA41401.1 multidrug ABC transporter ATP-binding protein [Streptomyces griseus]RAN18729.1 multidrug ABC transporter ATP-binding protein [Streptomyces badius]RAN26626.1 multidrug ABC transporter ATP-binding protein [Streptomyces badius]
MITAHGLTKRYGDRTVVQDLDFTVRPGTVTGFLGPNGAGKSTTMRMLLGLDTPTQGRSTVNGRSYATHPAPLTQVGALLEARSVHPGRSAFNHLMALAHTHGIPRRRVEEVIDLAGLTDAAHRRVKGFSLGMGQRLGVASALLGDPATVILDEPVNGLDPEGVLWIRTLLTSLAAEGRTVLVSSHLMSEMALTADHLIVIGRGRLLADTTVAELIRSAGGASVKVVTPQPEELKAHLTAPNVTVTVTPAPVPTPGSHELRIRGVDTAHIGRVAATHAITLHELTPQTVSLEQAFMDLTQESVDHRQHQPTPATGAAA